MVKKPKMTTVNVTFKPEVHLRPEIEIHPTTQSRAEGLKPLRTLMAFSVAGVLLYVLAYIGASAGFRVSLHVAESFMWLIAAFGAALALAIELSED